MIKKETYSRKALLASALLSISAVFSLSSCNGVDDADSNDFSDWRRQNVEYVQEMENKQEDNTPFFTKIQPDWAPAQMYSLVHWHNDKALTEKNLIPMDNSTVDIVYELLDINGKTLGSSYANTDSVYTSRPNQNITGIWAALTTIHEGDSVTVVVPYEAGYGTAVYGDIPPYSTLIFNLKLKKIRAYETE